MPTPDERRAEERAQRRAAERRREQEERRRKKERERRVRAEVLERRREQARTEERRRAQREREQELVRAQRREQERREAQRARQNEQAREEQRRRAQREREQEHARAKLRVRERLEAQETQRQRVIASELRAQLRSAQARERREQAARDEHHQAHRTARLDAELRTRRRARLDDERADTARAQQRPDEQNHSPSRPARDAARASLRRERARAEQRKARVLKQAASARQQRKRSEAREAERAEERHSERAHLRQAERQAARRNARTGSDTGRRLPAPAPEGSAQLPWLPTRDALVVDERGAPVTLRGVRIAGLERAQPRATAYEPPFGADDLQLLADFGVNAVAIPIAQDLVLEGRSLAVGGDYLTVLDGVVAALASSGIYTFVQLSLLSSTLPTHVAGGDDEYDPALPNPESIDLWSILGRRYAENPAVLFDLFGSPHAPGAGDATGALVPNPDWPLWRRWVLALLGELRRVHPRSLAVVRGLAHGLDVTGFPLRHADGTEPPNVIYGSELRTSNGGLTPLTPGLSALARIRPAAVLDWRPGSDRAAESTGRQLAAAGAHWIAAGWSDGGRPLVALRDGRLRPTPTGRAVERVLAQPAAREPRAAPDGSGGGGLLATAARQLLALAVAQAGAPVAPAPPDTADATGNILLWPPGPLPQARHDILAATEGGLVSDAALRPRVSAVIGPGATVRGVAAVVRPIFAGAAGAAAPAPSVDEIARAIVFYNRFYLPVPGFAAYRSGLRLPLPIELDAANGQPIVNFDSVRLWDAGFDAGWQLLLERRPGHLATADEGDLAVDVVDFLGAHSSARARGIALNARVLTNPFEALFFAFELLRELGADAFDVALQFIEAAVNHQLELVGSLTAGHAILTLVERTLAAQPPAPTSAQQQALARARPMLAAALRPHGLRAPRRELPETPDQLKDRGAIPQRVQAAPQDPAGGVHRTVLGRDVLAGRVGTYPPVGAHFYRGAATTGRLPADAFIAAHGAELNPLGDARLAARLAVVAAISPNEGALDAVRMQDRGILSTGIQQWTFYVNNEGTALLWRYKDLAPEEFELYFALYDLDVRRNVGAGGAVTFVPQQIQPNGARIDLTTQAARVAFFGGNVVGNTTTFDTVWAARFRTASVNSLRYKLAQAVEGAARFDRIERDVGNLAIGGVPRPLAQVFNSQHAAALILDQHINAWANVRHDLQAAVNNTPANPDPDVFERAATASYAASRNLEDAGPRTRFINGLGLDPAHGSFGGW